MCGMSRQYIPLDKHSLGCNRFHIQHYFDSFFVVVDLAPVNTLKNTLVHLNDQ